MDYKMREVGPVTPYSQRVKNHPRPRRTLLKKRKLKKVKRRGKKKAKRSKHKNLEDSKRLIEEKKKDLSYFTPKIGMDWTRKAALSRSVSPARLLNESRLKFLRHDPKYSPGSVNSQNKGYYEEVLAVKAESPTMLHNNSNSRK